MAPVVSSSMALMALCLLCAAMNAHAACCTSGQPTYKGSAVNFVGLPTCSDGPCSGSGFDYRGAGASESPNPKSCCDTENAGGWTYNPPATQKSATWPPFKQFPTRWPGTSPQCNIDAPRYRCTIGGQLAAFALPARLRSVQRAAARRTTDDPKDRVTIKIVKESLDAQRMVSHVVDELKSKRDKEEDPQFWIDGLDDDDDGIEVQVEQIMATVYYGTVAKHFHGNYRPFTLLTFNVTWEEVKPKKKQQQAASLLQQQQAASLQQQQQSEGEFEDEFGRGDDLVDHKKSAALILLKSGDLSGAAALLSEAAGEQPSDQRQLQKLDLLAAAGVKVAALADKKRQREKKDAPNHGEAAMLVHVMLPQATCHMTLPKAANEVTQHSGMAVCRTSRVLVRCRWFK
ncbi:hypothetical protein COO60DRAFT_1625795 [Scenedesmus sp. NREL 46B-D3]|nr:hypothetical protein COO60DRAFT_1625795 [Scenedesmus sp. NREL 46B-D3]